MERQIQMQIEQPQDDSGMRFVTQHWKCMECGKRHTDTDEYGGMCVDSVYDAYIDCPKCGCEKTN